MNKHSLERVVACGRRILKAPARETPWDDATRSSVLRALLDRSDGDADLERLINDAQAGWKDRASFESWLDAIARS